MSELSTSGAAKRSAKHLQVPSVPAERGKSGKRGLNVTNPEFLATLFSDLPEGARPLVCAKSNDPGVGGFFAQDALLVDKLCTADKNTYFNHSSFYPGEDGKLSAKKDRAAACHALVLDDVGTKVPSEAVPDVTPTWVLETSPGNFQVGFKFGTPITDPDEVEAIQQAVFEAGKGDSGAGGMSRWMRLPAGINGKPKYRDEGGKPFQCQLLDWNPDVAYEGDELVRLLVPDVQLKAPRKAAPRAAPGKRAIPVINPEVYIPAEDEDPVATASKQQGFYKRDLGDGRHDLTCPWCDEHTGGEDTGTCYFEPSALYPLGGFKCQHGHCSHRTFKDLLEHLSLTRQDVRNKPRIRAVPGELPAMVEAAELVLAATGEYFSLNGTITRISRNRDGDFVVRPQSEADLTLALAKHADWEYFREKDQQWRRGHPFKEAIRLLVQRDDCMHLPLLKGLAWQPVLDSDGKLLFEAGYDPASQLFLAFEPKAYMLPEPTRENALAALGELDSLLDEFRFATPRDKATALAIIFTAALRAGLGRCPAGHVRAPASGSGKSYLCELIALFASPRPPAKISYPTRDEEASKAMLAVLLSAPAVVEFDDMATDWKSFGAINRMLTSSTIADRLLGASQTATVSTDVLVLGSGNNTGPTGDLLRRVCVIDLDTREETPVTIHYSGNPVAIMAANREAYIAHVLTILRAWQVADCPRAELPPIATYNGHWSDFCRQPLVWLGLDDPAQGLIEQLKTDESRPILDALLKAWFVRFGDRPMKVRDFRDEMDGPLEEAIADLPFMEGGPFNAGKFGWYLKRNANRLVDGHRLEKAPISERNAWRVVRADGAVASLPVSPPSGAPDAGRSFD